LNELNLLEAHPDSEMANFRKMTEFPSKKNHFLCIVGSAGLREDDAEVPDRTDRETQEKTWAGPVVVKSF
jgi:hypothetical protein